MKKILLVTAVAFSLSACVQPAAPKEDSRLKQAYSACINTAEGNPDKIEACQSVLNVLRQEKEHKVFAEKETVNVLDYQKCIQARKSGNDEAAKVRCDKIWQEIRANNG